MNNFSIFLKSVICVLVCIVMSLSTILMNTTMFYGYSSMFILGGFCGIIIAIVTKSNTLKRTIIARFMGLFSAVITQYLLLISKIPYHIIKFTYIKYDAYGEAYWPKDIRYLMENEMYGYILDSVSSLHGLLASFFTTVVVIFIAIKIKNRRKGT